MPNDADEHCPPSIVGLIWIRAPAPRSPCPILIAQVSGWRTTFRQRVRFRRYLHTARLTASMRCRVMLVSASTANNEGDCGDGDIVIEILSMQIEMFVASRRK